MPVSIHSWTYGSEIVQFDCPKCRNPSASSTVWECIFLIFCPWLLSINAQFLLLWEPILITPERERLKMGKWNSPNLSEKQGFQCFWHSNWTIWSLSSQFSLVSKHAVCPPNNETRCKRKINVNRPREKTISCSFFHETSLLNLF